MKTRLTLALAMAVSAGTVTFVVASSLKHEQASAAEPVRADEHTVTLVRPMYQPRSDRGPRIIVVPQQRDLASLGPNTDPEPDDDTDDVTPPAPLPQRVKPQREKSQGAKPAAAPRWQPRAETPPPPATPPRKVLGAGRSIHDGPTPIRPLPRYNANTRSEPGEKFAPPNPPVTVSSAPPPPAELMNAEDIPPATATHD